MEPANLAFLSDELDSSSQWAALPGYHHNYMSDVMAFHNTDDSGDTLEDIDQINTNILRSAHSFENLNLNRDTSSYYMGPNVPSHPQTVLDRHEMNISSTVTVLDVSLMHSMSGSVPSPQEFSRLARARSAQRKARDRSSTADDSTTGSDSFSNEAVASSTESDVSSTGVVGARVALSGLGGARKRASPRKGSEADDGDSDYRARFQNQTRKKRPTTKHRAIAPATPKGKQPNKTPLIPDVRSAKTGNKPETKSTNWDKFGEGIAEDDISPAPKRQRLPKGPSKVSTQGRKKANGKQAVLMDWDRAYPGMIPHGLQLLIRRGYFTQVPPGVVIYPSRVLLRDKIQELTENPQYYANNLLKRENAALEAYLGTEAYKEFARCRENKPKTKWTAIGCLGPLPAGTVIQNYPPVETVAATTILSVQTSPLPAAATALPSAPRTTLISCTPSASVTLLFTPLAMPSSNATSAVPALDHIFAEPYSYVDPQLHDL